MILSDTEITERILFNDPTMIVNGITHQEKEGVLSYGVSSYGYDLRLASIVKSFETFARIDSIDPKNFKNECLAPLVIYENLNKDHSTKDAYVELPPHTYALGHTVETINIPDNVLGICLGKSTYARCGLLVNTTPAEPGWSGQLVLELYNTTPIPIRLYINEGIAQMIFLVGVTPTKGYGNRKYQNQRGIVTAKI